MQSFLEDLWYALKNLRHRRGFAATFIITLALATGANIAIFSIFYAVLLKPLPYADPDRIYMIWEDATQYGFPLNSPAPANYMDWKNQSRSFSTMAAYSQDTFVFTGYGEPAQLRVASVSSTIFSLLGYAQASRGRLITQADDTAGAPRVCVLTHRFWHARFSGDETIIGKSITLDGNPVEVVGVLPESFVFPEGEVDLLRPFAWSRETQNNREDHYLGVLGRLRGEVPESSALQELKLMMQRLETAYPETNKNLGVQLETLRHHVSGDLSMPIAALFGAVTLVLMIACANLAGLQFSHAADRLKEMTIRSALGATAFRLGRMLLLESVVLALLGGVLGLLASSWIIKGASILLPEQVLTVNPVQSSIAVVLFAMLLAVFSGLLSGIAPALQLSRESLSQQMKEGSPKLAGGRNRVRSAFVIGQVALCVCLVTAAGLMIRSMGRLLSVPLGFNPEHAVSLRTTLSPRPYADYNTRMNFYSQVLEKARKQEGVVAAGYTSHLPLEWSGDNNTFVVEGVPEPPPGQENIVSVRVISSDYFRALGASFVQGRDFDGTERLDTPGVVIVNEALARRYWPKGEAVSRRIHRGKPVTPDGWLTIVGVVSNLHQSDLEVAPNPEIYLPYTQRKPFYFAPQDLVVRVKGDPLLFAGALRNIIHETDQDQPVSSAKLLSETVRLSSAQRFAQSVLFSAFGLMALLLAALGIYGLMSHMVVRRTPEIGIRVALGARPAELIKLVLAPAMGMTAAGLGLGMIASFGLSRVMQSLLFQVSPRDLITFIAAPLILVCTAWIASWLPALRATRIDPISALRSE